MGENTYSRLWTSLELVSYQDQGTNLTWVSISPCEASPERILWRCSLNTKGLTLSVQSSPGAHCSLHSSTPLWHLYSGETARENRGLCRQVGEGRCEEDVLWLLCRQGRWSFTALATTTCPCGHKSCLSNHSFMAPDVASPRSRHNL